MNKSYYSLGLMSGTSGDGVDASFVISDGKNKFDVIYEKYEEYPPDICREFHALKEKILNSKDLENHGATINDFERKITIFNTTM